MKRTKGKKAAILFLLPVIALWGCGTGTKIVKQQKTDIAMGTIIHQTIYVKDSQEQDLTEGVMEQIRMLEQEGLSRRLDTSELYAINSKAGSPEGIDVSEEMMELLKDIWSVSEASEGALDVTIGEVVQLWDIDSYAAGERTDFQLPKEEELKAALEDTGYERVAFKENRILLPENMKLDLGAVGKGITCGKLTEYLEQQKVEGAVISVGGSILTYGSKPDGTPWVVSIIDPENTSDNIGCLTLEGQWCVSTSGSYERYVEVDGVRYHHILNPATGYPSDSGVSSVTVLTKDGLLSDALSTACFVLGEDKGMELAEELDAYVLFVDKEGKLSMSEGMNKYFQAW